MDSARRRQSLGARATAALPAVWKALARKGWSHAELARRMKKSNGDTAKLLYGDVSIGLKDALLIATLLGIQPVLWTKDCPANWRPHEYESLRPKKIERGSGASLPSSLTGTED